MARRTALALALLGTLAAPPSLHGQVAVRGADTTAVEEPAGDPLGEARAAQARFERRRHAFLPITISVGSGSCDERVGRFCTWYGEGEWYPVPEREEIVQARADLLRVLDSLQTVVAAEEWIVGQRVWYRAEGGDWEGALRVARRCGVESWWCAALEGFALHGAGRYEAAQAAFDAALAGMPPERADEWLRPRRAIDGRARDVLDDALEISADSARAALELLWTLADPLFLVPGNDRRTAHLARWTYSALRERARNPFRIRWGDDLEQLTVRHGWELGWERAPRPGALSRDDAVIGHKHPEGRDYMPPGEVLRDASAATEEALTPSRSRPRSLYAPDYAPVLLPMDGQLAAFPRTAEVVVVATHPIPADTTFHSGHDHPLPWLEPGDQEELDDRRGLYAYGLADGRLRGESGRTSERALALHLPPGPYVLSAEVWSPPRRRAGRTRVGLRAATVPEDVATLSDLLLLRTVGDRVATLEAALGEALPSPAVRAGEPFAIGWEVSGLGFRPETLRYEVSVTRTDAGLLRRIGRFLRLSARPAPLVLSWEEPGPVRPGHVFRTLDLEVPALEPGRYEVRLTLYTAGRSDTVTSLALRVDPSGASF